MSERCDHCGSTYCRNQERPPMLVDGDKLHDIRESIADDAQGAGREVARMIAELTIRRLECAVALYGEELT